MYFQGRETVNRFVFAVPGIVQEAMDRFAKTHRPAVSPVRLSRRAGCRAGHCHDGLGRRSDPGNRGLFERSRRARRPAQGRLFRPFSVEHFVKALPATVKTVCILDRTKEPGARGEPLYLDAVTAVSETMTSGTAPFKVAPRVLGGRYGLGSKDFTPAMVKGVFDNMRQPQPKNHFTIGSTTM